MTVLLYKNPYPMESWQARLETLVRVGHGQIIRPPENIATIAEIIGTARHETNSKSGLNRTGSFANRVPEESLKMNILGVHGELLGHHLFWRKDIPFIFSKLLAASTDSTPDIVTELWSFDAKGIGHGWDKLANKEIFDKSEADYYIFIQIASCRYWIHSREAILAWPVKDVAPKGSEGHSLAYYEKIT